MPGVPVLSPSKPKRLKWVSPMSTRRDGKYTTISKAKAKKPLRLPVTNEFLDDELPRQALEVRRRREIAAFGSSTIPSPTKDQPMSQNFYLGGDGGDGGDDCYDGESNHYNMGRHDANNDDYDADSEDTDTESSESYESLKFRDVKEAVDQFEESCEQPPQSRKRPPSGKQRNHSVTKKRLENAWESFIVAVTNLFTATSFPNESVCRCNSRTKLLVVDFVGKTTCRQPS
jgi:hypothetical protein